MPKAVILDMDGTLVDSNALHAEAWQRAFAKFGIEVSVEDARRQIGKGSDQLVPVFVPDEAQRKKIEKPLKDYRAELFQREYMPRVRPFPKVRDLLLRMRGAGLRVALASSAKKEELEQYKKIAGIEDLIEEDTTSSDTERSKPYPDVFQATLERLRVTPEEAVAIGDTPYDAESATRAGVKTIGFTCGGWPEEDLKRAGCVEVYRGAEDLLERFAHSLLVR